MKNYKKNIMIAALASMAFGGSAQAQEITKQDWGTFKLWIDPGHSGRENSGLYGYTEAEKVLRVGLATRAFLFKYTTADETTIGMTRDNDNAYVDLDERSDMANAWGADFFYSIHSDAGSPSKNSTVFLFGGWKSNGNYVEKTPNGGKRMGDIMCPNLTGVMYNTETRGNYYDR
ncbi:MAG: N-acetylmuramoyl-L-alanine amidase, partial [Sodaliphilus sp.]|nr:N-acetylmuramoyl-L-alanine amidase [Sodaliphilus sp.]MDY5020041.1 N-acetylmuramoyl-L-alanine amidase [Sodaliphilus sp.]